jgi:hypothetical protein
VLAGEHFRPWLRSLSPFLESWFVTSFLSFHHYNPFALLHSWMAGTPFLSWEGTMTQTGIALAVAVLLLGRAAGRLKAHFEERHYQPALDTSGRRRPTVGDRPLSWWAIKRVSEYAGRINLWLAGLFGLLYALYTVAGPHWPPWMGRQVFLIFDRAGGVPTLATGLVVLAAVPAAFQYGLWDSSAQDRCRRLELLLLTDLNGLDYWEAAAAAAWRRGRGYFAVAVALWLAAVGAGKLAWWQAAAAIAASVLLWALYFALGFRAFARGVQANGLGMLLTIGLPLLAFGLIRSGWPLLASLVPPGSVYEAATHRLGPVWLAGMVGVAVLTLVVGRRTLTLCEEQLRTWYDRHHGQKLMS